MRSGAAVRVKFGVLQFPGSCDEVDALAAPPGGWVTPSCCGMASAT